MTRDISDKPKGLELKIPPLLLVIVAAGLMWGLAHYAPIILFNFAGQLPVAVILVLIGIQFALAGVSAFQQQKTTVNPMHPEQSQVLVVEGVYRVSRNPMYLGFVFILAGFAVWLGSLTAFGVLPLFMLYLGRFQISPEERVLQARFNDKYSKYCHRVRRWL